ncbi:MAG TPA: ATP-binding protein, partial [Chloroflexota bacterium]|nr:ATP-binding protein [Chloroflexota bacterium]
AALDRLERLIGWRGGLASPIPAQHRHAGVLLYALEKESAALTPSDWRQLTTVARLVGLALEQARLSELERRRVREAAALEGLLVRITTADDATTVVDEVLSAAVDLLAADYAALNTIPSRPGERAWAVRRGYRSPPRVIATVYPPGTGLAGRAMRSRAPVVINAFGVDPAFPAAEFPVHVAEGMRSGISVPLLRPTGDPDTTGEAFGALVLGYRTPHRISQDQIDLTMTLAQQAAVALERARLLAGERRRAAELEALVESGHQLSAAIDQESVLRSIAVTATDTLGARDAVVAIVEWTLVGAEGEDVSEAQPVFRVYSEQSAQQARDQSTLPWEDAARRALSAGSMQMYIHGETLRETDGQGVRRARVGDVIALPIRSRHGVVAVVVLLGKQDGGLFGEDDVRVLHGFADQATSALENARLYEGERRARQDVEHAQQQGQAFLRIVAHDLKTPLTNIQGYAQLAQRLRGRLTSEDSSPNGELNDRLVAALGKIVDNCRRLQSLVESLQEAFRLGSGRFDLRRTSTDLVALVEQVVEEQRAVAPDHQFSVSAPKNPVIGQWDVERLRQVITNLVNNAVKYSPVGSRITLTVRRRDGNAILTVVDNGSGIARSDIASLFQPYTRLQQNRAVKGTGLGLYIVKGIVEAHGGKASAESAGEGAGAAFTVRLPLTPSAVGDIMAAPDAAATPDSAPGASAP